MTQYIIRRLLLVPLLLLGITALDFLFINLAPGDPVAALIDPNEMVNMSREDVEARREALGLNKPIVVRYGIWLREVLSGNLGYSIVRSQPVADMMLSGVQNTVLLLTLALVGSTILGIFFGIISALKPYSWLDYILTTLSFAGVAVPSFFFALVLIVVFAVELGWFPTSGLVTPGAPPSLADKVKHMVLPIIALSLGGTAAILRYTRNSMLEVLGEDYVTTARAKGLSNPAIHIRHALRNALLPIITVLGLSLPSIFGGSVIIETIFSIPGIGSILVAATQARDYPVMMGGILMSGILVLLSNLIADIAYAVADPRIRY